MKKEFRIWKDIPNIGGRWFEIAEDYKEAMIERESKRHIRASHINRNLSGAEKKTIIPFVEQCLCFKKDNYCTTKALYPYYYEFCMKNDMTPLRASTFATAIKVYVFLQQNIPGVLFSRKEPMLNINYIGFYNLGLKGETNLNG